MPCSGAVSAQRAVGGPCCCVGIVASLRGKSTDNQGAEQRQRASKVEKGQSLGRRCSQRQQEAAERHTHTEAQRQQSQPSTTQSQKALVKPSRPVLEPTNGPTESANRRRNRPWALQGLVRSLFALLRQKRGETDWAQRGLWMVWALDPLNWLAIPGTLPLGGSRGAA